MYFHIFLMWFLHVIVYYWAKDTYRSLAVSLNGLSAGICSYLVVQLRPKTNSVLAVPGLTASLIRRKGSEAGETKGAEWHGHRKWQVHDLTEWDYVEENLISRPHLIQTKPRTVSPVVSVVSFRGPRVCLPICLPVNTRCIQLIRDQRHERA